VSPPPLLTVCPLPPQKQTRALTDDVSDSQQPGFQQRVLSGWKEESPLYREKEGTGSRGRNRGLGAKGESQGLIHAQTRPLPEDDERTLALENPQGRAFLCAPSCRAVGLGWLRSP
jgi:hypothetical protein